jgi:hypothetical protein
MTALSFGFSAFSQDEECIASAEAALFRDDFEDFQGDHLTHANPLAIKLGELHVVERRRGDPSAPPVWF